MPRNELILLDPRSQPVRSMISAMDAASLGPGEWAELDNLRVEKGLLTCRGGMSAPLSTIMTSAAFRGMWSGSWGSGYCVVVAVDVGGQVRLLRSQDLATWVEITAASGQFGNTRMTTGKMVRFSRAPQALGSPSSDPHTFTVPLLAVNGTDAPRVLHFVAGTGYAAKLTDVSPPERVRDRPVRVHSVDRASGYYMATQSLVGGDLTDSSGGMSLALAGTAPDQQVRLTIATTTDTDDSATIGDGISNIAVTTLDRQLLIGVDTGYGQLWDKVKLEANSETLWDPSNAADYQRPIAIALDNTQRQIWVFNYPRRESLTNIGSFTLTWVADPSEAPASDQTADFFLFGLGEGDGLVKADAGLALTSMNTATCTESPGVVYSTYETLYIKDVGGPILNDLRLPRSPVLNAIFLAPVVAVTEAERDAGVDRVNFYIKESGSSRYRYIYSRTLTEYTSSWAYVTPGAEGDVSWIFAGPDHFETYYPDIDLPGGFQRAIPSSATELCYANNRLFIGAAGQIHISEHKMGFRTALLTSLEQGAIREDSATTLAIEGEAVKAITPIAASTAGSSTLFVLTDANVYAIAGHSTSQLSQVGRVANIGTPAPYSVAVDKGSLYFVDNEMQVRVIAGGSIQSISRHIVDDKLKAVPGARRPWMSGAVFGDRYYLAYTPSGSSNTKIILWDFARGMWTSDTPPVACSGLIAPFDGEAVRLLAIGQDGADLKVYDYDDPDLDQDLGSANIACTLSPYELHSPDGGLFHVGRCRAMIDDVNSASASIVRTYLPTSVAQTTSLSLDTSAEHIYREDRIEGATVTGSGQPVGPRCRVAFTVPLQAGRKIRYLSLEFTPLGGGHDRP